MKPVKESISRVKFASWRDSNAIGTGTAMRSARKGTTLGARPGASSSARPWGELRQEPREPRPNLAALTLVACHPLQKRGVCLFQRGEA